MKYLFKVNAENGVVNFCTIEDAPAMQQMGVDTSDWIKIESNIFNEQNKYKIENNQLILLSENEYDIYFPEIVLSKNKANKLAKLDDDFNASKKITIQNGNTLIIEHDTPQRDYFLQLIEVVSKLRPTEAVEYVQGVLGFRILSEIAAYIFKDLFTATLTNGTELNARKRNKTTIYNNALNSINNAATQTELDAIKWKFLNPAGIVIAVNDKATEMLEDPTVSDFAKAAINAAKDPITGEIHLVKTLEELAAGT